jgi:hypothetical protein
MIFSYQVLGTTINVPGDYSTIQEGINAAQNGDTVLVNDGLYYENINFRGKNIVVASRFIIDGDYNHIIYTIINGSQSTEVDTGSCVIFGSGEDSTAVIQGFTLTGGTGTSFDFGGGNFFREGGAIIMSNSSAMIKNNLTYNNEAAIVPGVDGGIRNNIIYANEGGGQYGTGGLMVWVSDPWTAIIENNTIFGNISTTTSGGLSVEQTSAIIRNNIIWGNTQQTGAQVTGYQSSTFEYCNTEEIYPGQGNISINPDFLPQNFLLNSLSPCIDTGDPGTSFNDKEDPGNPGFALYPSLGAMRNDIGAYGGPGAMMLPDISGIVGVQEEGTAISPSSVLLHQNYPNPFNPTTKISYEVPELSFVSLKVFDVLGNEVAALVENEKPLGSYEVEFDAAELTSGIYLYKLIAGNYIETKKMILLK